MQSEPAGLALVLAAGVAARAGFAPDPTRDGRLARELISPLLDAGGGTIKGVDLAVWAMEGGR